MEKMIEKIVEHLKASDSKWISGKKLKLGELFDISFNEHNIFLYWSDTWKNHDSIFPVSLIAEAMASINTSFHSLVRSRDVDVYTYDDGTRRGLYLSITIKE